MFSIATELQCGTVDELSERMSTSEMYEWKEFFKIREQKRKQDRKKSSRSRRSGRTMKSPRKRKPRKRRPR